MGKARWRKVVRCKRDG